MAELQITSLSISGHAGSPVPNRFFHQESAATALAVLFPGLWYTCDMPLLFYPLKLLLQHAAEVLQVRADYTHPAYQSLPPQERAAWLVDDARAALQAALAQGRYTHLVLVGKSIGSAALASLINRPLDQNVSAIWLTPLLRRPALVEAALHHTGPALFVAGTGDEAYDAGALARIRQATRAQALIIEGADHSLEIPGDIHQSLLILERVMRTLDDFLGNCLK